MNSDIEHLKWLFQIEDDGGIEGKCVQIFAIFKRIVKVLNQCVIPFRFRKEKQKTLMTSSELYLVFDQFTQYKGQEKPYFILL